MMLKISQTEDGCRGARLMEWWGGEGAARVFGCEGPALLMERAIGPASLADLARSGHDDEACRILCSAATQMHALRPRPLLAAPRDISVLHGDLHHDNVLDLGTRGWLAVAPWPYGANAG